MIFKNDFASERRNMVKRQIQARGITDPRLLDAFQKVERHRFVPESHSNFAYEDGPLQIGMGQTISQPYIVALMIAILNIKKSDIVLEIGTGSGYQTAILAEIAKKVYSIERIAPLANKAEEILSDLGYENVVIQISDGTCGWKREINKKSDKKKNSINKFDAIIVSAAAPDMPGKLVEQLAENGKMVIPVGSRFSQDLVQVMKINGKIKQKNFGGCRFVPLVGENAWTD